MGTHCELEKKLKISVLPLPPNTKRKNMVFIECMLNIFIGYV
jgi:hypothetical protein